MLQADIPNVKCQDYGDICYDNQRRESLQVVTRNVQLMYGSDPGRYTYAIRVPSADNSGRFIKQKVFQSKTGWGSDSEDDSAPRESVLVYDDVARSNLDELILQPTKIRRLNGSRVLTPTEYPSIHMGSFVDSVSDITRVSYLFLLTEFHSNFF